MVKTKTKNIIFSIAPQIIAKKVQKDTIKYR